MNDIARCSDVLPAEAQARIAQLLRMPSRPEPLVSVTADRIWQLRANMTAYDAGCVTLPEHRTASLLTCDRKYAAVPGLCCTVELLN